MTLLPSQLTWIGLKFLDPIGRVFLHNGTYYRALYLEAAPWLQKLKANSVMEGLVSANLCASFNPCVLEVDGFGPILELDTAVFSTPLAEQPFTACIEAAKKWVKIQSLLSTKGYELIDGHPANFAMFFGDPMWIDHGSIQEIGRKHNAFEEFLRFFLRPLFVASHNPSLYSVAKRLFATGGVSEEECFALTGENISDRPHQTASAKLAYFQALIDALDIHFPKGKWADYTSDSEQAFHLNRTENESDRRFLQFDKFLERANPETAIDIASSAGAFSISMARKGITCLSNDREEAALEQLRTFAINHKLPINVQVYDALWGSPIQGQLACAMAVSHHLFLSEKADWPLIARMLANRTTNALITDFMPDGLGIGAPHPDPLPSGYSLDNFVSALKLYFKTVEVTDYKHEGRSKRIMLYCEQKK